LKKRTIGYTYYQKGIVLADTLAILYSSAIPKIHNYFVVSKPSKVTIVKASSAAKIKLRLSYTWLTVTKTASTG